jgi:hypothetical protein
MLRPGAPRMSCVVSTCRSEFPLGSYLNLEATTMRSLCILCFFWLLSPMARAAEAPSLAEVFLCKLQPGKTMADVDATILSWQREFAVQPAFDGYFAAVWTPLRANTPYDLAWIGVTDDLNEWAALSEGPRAASEAHFADVVTCESGLHFVSTVYEGLVVESGDDEGIVEAYACTLHDGKTIGDLQSGNDAYLKAIDAEADRSETRGRQSASVSAVARQHALRYVLRGCER